MRIYVASSWRNVLQQDVVRDLRSAGHEVYDFREPEPGIGGFAWSEIDARWKEWTPLGFRKALTSSLAHQGFTRDMDALEWARAVVLVLPCGRSAHLEFGWAMGKGKIGLILLSEGEPELMYKMADHLCLSCQEVCELLSAYNLDRLVK